MGICEIAPALPACAVKDVVGGIAKSIDFAKDPLGYIATQMQAAAAGLSSTVLPEMEKLTHPDLSAPWFLDAYKVSFALAMFIFVGVLGWNFVLLARRRVSADDVMETLAFYTPLFLGGVILGPMLGTLLLSLTGALTDSLIGWGVSGSVDATSKALQDAIVAGDPAQMVGGSIIAILVFLCLIVALLLAFVVLLVMLVTLYLTGAIIPLSLVWLVHPRQRAKGMKVVMVWVGICFSHVLLFLLLGVAFHMVGGLATDFAEPGLTILANLAVAVIALLMATLSPFALLKFAPVGPSSASGGGASMAVPGRSSGGSYPESGDDSQSAQMSRDSGGAEDGAGEDAGGAESASGGGAGGLMGKLAESRAGQSSSSMEPAGGASAEGGKASTGAEAGGDSSSSGLATEGTEAGSGTAALASAGSKTSDSGQKLKAVGTAAEATGAGAPVGAVVQALGVGLEAAGSAVSATAEMAQSAGDMAAEHMEHGDTNQEG